MIGEDKPFIKTFFGLYRISSCAWKCVPALFNVCCYPISVFFGGETNIGVAGYTYSQYARRGFNELVIVAFFSLVMILGLSTITRREKEI